MRLLPHSLTTKSVSAYPQSLWRSTRRVVQMDGIDFSIVSNIHGIDETPSQFTVYPLDVDRRFPAGICYFCDESDEIIAEFWEHPRSSVASSERLSFRVLKDAISWIVGSYCEHLRKKRGEVSKSLESFGQRIEKEVIGVR